MTLRALGAEPVVLDVLDAEAVGRAVVGGAARCRRARGHGAVRQSNLRNFDETFAVTNRLRTEGTDNLLAAAQAAGTGRSWPRASPAGRTRAAAAAVKTEDDPLDPTPPASCAQTLEAIRHLETTVVGAGRSRGSCCATAVSTGPARRWRGRRAGRAGPQAPVPDRRRRRRRLVVRPHRRRRRGDGLAASSAARPASTTSSTTSRRRVASGCRTWPRRSARSRPVTCRSGSAGSPPARQVVVDDDRGCVARRTRRRSASSGGRPSTRPGAKAS